MDESNRHVRFVSSDSLVISVNREVVMEKSKLFREMLSVVEHTDDPIPIPEIDGETLQQLIARFYGIKIKFTSDNIGALLKAADYLQYDDAFYECCRYVYGINLRLTKWVELVEFAWRSNNDELRAYLDEFVLNNLQQFVVEGGNDDWKSLSVWRFKHYIGHNELNISSEEQAIEAIEAWCTFNNAFEYYADLIEELQIHRVPLDLINEKIVNKIPNGGSFYEQAELWQTNVEKRTLEMDKKARKRRGTSKLLVVSVDTDRNERRLFKVYDKDFNRWTDILTIPADQTCSSLTCIDDKLLILLDDCFQSVDLKNGAQEMYCRRKKRQYASSGVLNNQLYMIGGTNSRRHFDSVERWNKDLHCWESQASMEAPRYGAAVVADEDHLLLYAIGGVNKDGTLDTIECFNPFTGMWTTRASMKHKRCSPGVASMGSGCILIVGGTGNGDQHLYSAEIYDFYKNTCQECAPLGFIRKYATCVSLDNRLLATGHDEHGYFILEEYNELANNWTKLWGQRSNMEYKSVVCNVPANSMWGI